MRDSDLRCDEWVAVEVPSLDMLESKEQCTNPDLIAVATGVGSDTRRSLTYVPFLLPRSSITTPSASIEILA